MKASSVVCAKFQFELRYSHILDFRDQYKAVIAPYLKLASGFQILNQQALEEHVRLEFIDSSASIEVRWDRMILLSEGDLDRMKPKAFLPSKIFWEIYDKLSKLNSFGLFANYIASVQGVEVMSIGSQQCNDSFSQEYFVQKKLASWIGKDELLDLAIMVEVKTPDGIEVLITHGPFHGIKDIQKRGLIPFKSESLSHLFSAEGRMVDIKIVRRGATAEHADFVQCIKIAQSYQEKMN
jgi:hypothetical protein